MFVITVKLTVWAKSGETINRNFFIKLGGPGSNKCRAGGKIILKTSTPIKEMAK